MDNKEKVTDSQNQIRWKDSLVKMRIRKKVAVLRTSNHNIAKDREIYFHIQLMLFYTWRVEGGLIDG